MTNTKSRRGNGDRSMFNNGKGDADRSPGWRDHYDDISWPDGGKRQSSDGFSRRGGKLVKRYGTAEQPKPVDTAPTVVIH